jgi:hypothetical protein
MCFFVSVSCTKNITEDVRFLVADIGNIAYSTLQGLCLLTRFKSIFDMNEYIYIVGACWRRLASLFRCVTLGGLKRAHWKIEADWHIQAVFVWWWYIHVLFTNPIPVLVLESSSHVFLWICARKEVGWPKKLRQTVWIRQVPGGGEKSNEPMRSIKDRIWRVAEQLLATSQEGLFSVTFVVINYSDFDSYNGGNLQKSYYSTISFEESIYYSLS